MESLSDIAVFVSVVEAGSFTSAADRLSLSKSVVSKYVTRLEERLGVRLLNRTTRRLSLTEAGRIFHQRSLKGLQEIELAEAEVSHLQQEPRGTLRINAPMSFGVLHISPLVPEFISQYPGLKIDMNLDDKKIDAIDEGFDVSIRISELPDSSMVARRLGPCRHVIVGSPGYLAQRKEPRTPQDLKEHDIVFYQYQESATQWHFRTPGGKRASVTVSGTTQMNSSLAVRSTLINNGGLARIPTFVVGRDIQEGRLRQVLGNYQCPEVSIFAVFPQRKLLAPKTRAFIEFMAERITSEPYWDRIEI